MNFRDLRVGQTFKYRGRVYRKISPRRHGFLWTKTANVEAVDPDDGFDLLDALMWMNFIDLMPCMEDGTIYEEPVAEYNAADSAPYQDMGTVLTEPIGSAETTEVTEVGNVSLTQEDLQPQTEVGQAVDTQNGALPSTTVEVESLPAEASSYEPAQSYEPTPSYEPSHSYESHHSYDSSPSSYDSGSSYSSSDCGGSDGGGCGGGD